MDPTTLRLMMGASRRAPVVLEDGVAGASSINFATTPAANTLILFFGQKGGSNVILPSGYTTIAQRTGANARFLCAYKVAAGNETSVSSNNADIVGYAFVSVGSVLDVTGTVATDETVSGITPANLSLVFLVVATNSGATRVSQNGTGWTEVFNTVTELGINRELIVWRKAGTGTATETVTISIDASPVAGVQFSVRF